MQAKAPACWGADVSWTKRTPYSLVNGVWSIAKITQGGVLSYELYECAKFVSPHKTADEAKAEQAKIMESRGTNAS